MSRLRTSFVLGYHGCEREAAERILAGEIFKESIKDFDWLGPGAYFWESDPERAREWAEQRKGARAFIEPYVIGAVIDLGNCLDLTTREGAQAIRASYESFRDGQTLGGLAMPVNEDLKSDINHDRLLRMLDCAVIRHLHKNIEDENNDWRDGGMIGPAPPLKFDTVRGMFPEGGEAFAGSGFKDKTHTQIAVISQDCIKGVFRIRNDRPYAINKDYLLCSRNGKIQPIGVTGTFSQKAVYTLLNGLIFSQTQMKNLSMKKLKSYLYRGGKEHRS